MIFGKTLSYWGEKIGGEIAGAIVFCVILLINPFFSHWRPFIVAFPPIGVSAFGFLLTFLSIILQGNSKTIERMMNRDKLYNKFIDFNKRIVIISLILSLYSYAIGYSDLQIIHDLFSSEMVRIIENVLIGTFCGLFVWFVIDTFHFTRLFYILIRVNNKKES